MPDAHPPRRPVDDAELLASATPIEPPESEPDLIDLADADRHDPNERSATSAKIRSTEHDRAHHHDNWSRKPNVTGHGAIHVKTFVSKLRLDAIHHLDEQINTWLDEHPEYEVKFVNTTIGDLVGKTTDPALFVNVWV